MSRVSAKQKFAYLAAVVRRITFYFTLHSAFEEVTGSLDSWLDSLLCSTGRVWHFVTMAAMMKSDVITKGREWAQFARK